LAELAAIALMAFTNDGCAVQGIRFAFAMLVAFVAQFAGTNAALKNVLN